MKWGTIKVKRSMHFDFFCSASGLDLIFFGFMLKEREGKRGDFVFIVLMVG